jgi:hypothetical protein
VQTENFNPGNGFFAILIMKRILVASLIFIGCNPQGSQSDQSAQDTVSKQVNVHPIDSTSHKPAPDNEFLIVPGVSIGKISLGTDASHLQDLLGKPDMSDAAMGKAWLTWNGKRDEHNNATELDIFTTYKDNSMREKTVHQVRTTSAAFATQNGSKVYASFEKIQSEFPGIRKTAGYKDDSRQIQIYDDRENGISFEFAEAGRELICTGIIIHEKGKSVLDIYRTKHPEMKIYTEAPASN